MMVLTGALVVAQDEIETYTINRINPPGVDFQIGDPVAFIHECLGGVGGPFDINVDKVIVHGNWRGDISIADSFHSAKGKVFLAGDAGM